MMIELGTRWIMAENVTWLEKAGANTSVYVSGRSAAVATLTGVEPDVIARRVNAALGLPTGPTPGSSV